MTFHTVHASAVAPQAWRNGGGQTRELLAWPEGAAWQMRVSRADIAADGPFSEFAGVQRWFTVLEGSGVRLQFAHGTTALHAGDAPLQFDGASAPHCTLIDGPTQDLNLMVRGGRGSLQVVHSGDPWVTAFAVRGVYTAGGGIWSDGARTVTLNAHTLLWCNVPSNAAWTFVPESATSTTGAGDGAHHGANAVANASANAPANAWWLGFNPDNTP